MINAPEPLTSLRRSPGVSERSARVPFVVQSQQLDSWFRLPPDGPVSASAGVGRSWPQPLPQLLTPKCLCLTHPGPPTSDLRLCPSAPTAPPRKPSAFRCAGRDSPAVRLSMLELDLAPGPGSKRESTPIHPFGSTRQSRAFLLWGMAARFQVGLSRSPATRPSPGPGPDLGPGPAL